MKHVLAGFLWFSVIVGTAQSWFPNEAEWYYRFIPAGIAAEGHVRIAHDRDTTINGVPSHALGVFQTLGSVWPPYEYSTQRLTDLIVTEQEGLVLLYNGESALFDTLYHMAAIPGDHWGFPDMPDWMDCGTESYYMVVDTGTVVMDAIPLRWLAVDLQYISSDLPGLEYSRPDTIIERIGGLHSYFYPQDECNASMDGNIGGPLTCYFDADLTYGPGTPTDLACAYLPNSVREDRSLPLRIFPNPTSGIVNVELSYGREPIHLELFDARGRSQKIWQLQKGTEQLGLDLSTAAEGGYLLSARTGTRVLTARILILR